VPDTARAHAAPGASRGRLAGVRAGAARLARSPAVRDSAIALIASRVLIWAVGVPAYLHFGVGPDVRFDHSLLTQSQGAIGNAVIAPAVRWDSNWYVDTAVAGYLREDQQPIFFPFYSLLMRWAGTVTGSVVVAGIAISLVAFLVALVMLHRLTERELGAAAARRAVYLISFFPFALFFSAIYTESLFLALELGALWAGRRGRWWLAGLLGAAGAATRNTGVLMAPVLAVLYLYGPRDDRGPDRQVRAWRPRYRVRPDVAWLGLVPLGLATYLVWLGTRFGDPFVPFHAAEQFRRSFDGPLSAVWEGAGQALGAVGVLLGGAGGQLAALRAIGLFVVAALALVAAVGVLRRLPAVYGAYTAVMMLAGLSFPQVGHPLASAGRYLATVFPLFMWAGWRLRDRRVLGAVLVAFALGLAYASAMFATWRFVA
jgi:mannosyltransferase PIG-V